MNLSKADDLIKSVMESSKLNDGKTYGDEPLIFTAAQMKNYTPPKYAEMRKLAMNKSSFFLSDSGIFYKQAKFMEDFSDDFEYHGEFIRHMPTYNVMNNMQLRGYFSWRTNLRKGNIKRAPFSFAILYMYELINLVGVGSPEEGFFKLSDFVKKYSAYDNKIALYSWRWITDFAVYYGLSPELLNDLPETAEKRLDKELLCLINYETENAEELLRALACFSSYNILTSSFYKNHPLEMADAAYRLFDILKKYYDAQGGGDIYIHLFGKPFRESYLIFNSAVFYEREPHPDCDYQISSIFKYSCKNNNWTVERFFPVRDKAGKLGILLKGLDYYLRQRYRIKSSLKKPELTDMFEAVLKKAVDEHYAEKLKRDKPVINVDISKLQGIRDISLITRDKLIIDEETDSDEPEILAAESVSEVKDIGMDKKHTEILLSILNCENADDIARENGIMLSVAVDAINERLFDDFGDTVIEYRGDTPSVIEDYEKELREMLGL